MKSLPRDVVPTRETAVFTETSVPEGLRRSHTTRAGTWGRIRVLEGSLLYRILEPTLEAWRIPYSIAHGDEVVEQIDDAFRTAASASLPAAVLLSGHTE